MPTSWSSRLRDGAFWLGRSLRPLFVKREFANSSGISMTNNYVSTESLHVTNDAAMDAVDSLKENDMAFGWLKTVGKDIVSVFKWMGSAQGQTVIQSAEGVASAVGAPAALVNIANYWISKAISIEALSAAAGQQSGSGTTKAAAVLADVTPYVLAIAKANGLPEPTAADLANANTALVTFLNALGAGNGSPAPATPAAS